MQTTSTHLPLQEGEMVYKIITQLDKTKISGTFRLYDNLMSIDKIVHLMLGIHKQMEAVALHRTTKNIYRISTAMLGYIEGTREEGVPLYPPSTHPPGQEGASKDNSMNGYNIRWERSDSRESYYNFEDETRLMALKDIIILSPVELRDNIISR